MRNKQIIGVILISGIVLTGTGCATKSPTIAHVHIGHVVDGWETTPGQTGLFEAAETFAQTSIEAAQRASQADASLESRKSDINALVLASYPEYSADTEDPADGKVSEAKFGVRTALLEASRHIEFAADSDDASANVRAGARQFSINAQAVLDRCDLIAALGTETLEVNAVNEVDLLTAELLGLAQANLHGEDLNGDGIVGGQNSEEYGLKQLNLEIQEMINRENPPYSTVEQWYLFNLIRLPSGKWAFRQNSSGKKSGSSY